MPKPKFPKFNVKDGNDAAVIRDEVENLTDYVCEVEAWTVLSATKEKALKSALEWVPYAIRQLTAARTRLSSTEKDAIEDVQAALDLLYSFEPKIKAIILTNEDLKREAKEKKEKEKANEVAVTSP
ncbi:hypothetical protein F4811DRAFT_567782 [Daldinia bambusicola]|nr:hypothetical protein F4811DRAFT_567782 [Daldinia bambusicola]